MKYTTKKYTAFFVCLFVPLVTLQQKAVHAMRRSMVPLQKLIRCEGNLASRGIVCSESLSSDPSDSDSNSDSDPEIEFSEDPDEWADLLLPCNKGPNSPFYPERIVLTKAGLKNIPGVVRILKTARKDFILGVNDPDVKQRLTNAHLKSICRAHIPRLIGFSLNYCTSITDQAIRTIVKKAPRLRHLNLSYCNIGNFAAKRIGRYATNLTCLDISHCKSIEYRYLKCIISRCTLLKHINISGLPNAGNKTINKLRKCCPQLETLFAQELTEISDTSIQTLVDARSNNIKRINLIKSSITPRCKQYIDLRFPWIKTILDYDNLENYW